MTEAGRGIVTVFGGSGFIGRYAIQALLQDGWRVRVAGRRPDLAFHLQPLGRAGQVQAVQANIRYPDSVAAALRGADAVVNLVGILTETTKQSFQAVHADGAATLARAARQSGISSFVQLSAIGADPKSSSAYARSKAAGETAVSSEIENATVLRPSVVFGPEDDFFNRFAAMARISPVLPLIGGGGTLMQPVYVADVGAAIAAALDRENRKTGLFELGGPDVRSFGNILSWICETVQRRRILAPLPWRAAEMVGAMSEIANSVAFGLLPSMFLMTRDQVELLRTNNIVSAEAIAGGRTLAAFGIRPQSMDAIVPSYLYRFRKAGQFEARRVA